MGWGTAVFIRREQPHTPSLRIGGIPRESHGRGIGNAQDISFSKSCGGRAQLPNRWAGSYIWVFHLPWSSPLFLFLFFSFLFFVCYTLGSVPRCPP